MNKSTLAGIVGVVILCGGFAFWWRAKPAAGDSPGETGPSKISVPKPRVERGETGGVGGSRPRPEEPPAPKELSADARTERVKKILRDYQEIQAKMSADYGAAGQSFPGGLSAFLRQLALLEREKRADLAKAMTPQELEDYEIRETAAGQKMRTLLDGTAATDEQRRAVFHAEDSFNERFGFTFDMAPAALAVREAARQATQREIHAALGDELFQGWLQRDDPTYAHLAEFARQQNLPGNLALGLLNVRNGFTLSMLDIASAPLESAAERRAALVVWARDQIAGIAPLLPRDAGDREVTSWLGKSASAARP